MKSLAEIKNELLKLGATQRLQDLNQEREILVKLLKENNARDEERSKKVFEAVDSIRQNSKKKHWTQTRAGRKRMSEIQKARFNK